MNIKVGLQLGLQIVIGDQEVEKIDPGHFFHLIHRPGKFGQREIGFLVGYDKTDGFFVQAGRGRG